MMPSVQNLSASSVSSRSSHAQAASPADQSTASPFQNILNERTEAAHAASGASSGRTTESSSEARAAHSSGDQSAQPKTGSSEAPLGASKQVATDDQKSKSDKPSSPSHDPNSAPATLSPTVSASPAAPVAPQAAWPISSAGLAAEPPPGAQLAAQSLQGGSQRLAQATALSGTTTHLADDQTDVTPTHEALGAGAGLTTKAAEAPSTTANDANIESSGGFLSSSGAEAAQSAALSNTLEKVIAHLGATESSTTGSAASGPALTVLPQASDGAASQAAALNNQGTAASLATTASAAVAAPVGSGQFAAETATKLLYFAQNNIQSAQLSLNPAHLGPLDVQIRMSGEQVSLVLNADHADTRHAMESSLPKLREMFSEQGIQLGDLSVGSRAFSNGQDTQHRQPGGQFETANARGASASAETVAASPSLARSLQLVDTFA
jgi:flagellar hook-length control protein FliK